MNFLYIEELESTNKYCKENILNLDDMTVVYTGCQTAGRGRLNRSWSYVGAENIYASIVLKPSLELKDVYANLTQYLSLVLAETFEEYNNCNKFYPKIKWPNDVRIDGKKISGILAETVLVGGKLGGIILGFGVNLNCREDDLNAINQAATSLNIVTGMKIDRKKFLDLVINKFCLRYNNFINRGFSLIKNDYTRRAEFLNNQVVVKVFDKEISGIAKSINDDGSLTIVDENNKEHVLLIGDIL